MGLTLTLHNRRNYNSACLLIIFFCKSSNLVFGNAYSYNSMNNQASITEQVSCSSHALVPYSTHGILKEFYEKKRTFFILGIPEGITIMQDWQGNGVAGVVWEGAHILSKYISKNMDLKKKSVLELGAGTGLVGMVMAKLGANVTITDVFKALPLIQENVHSNFLNDKTDIKIPQVKELEWGKNLHKYESCYDYIIGTDIIYMEESFDALLDTICHLAKGTEARIILSAKLRYNKVQTFMTKLKSKYLTVNQLHKDKNTNVVIYECYDR